jgi:hypothetical protein
VIPSPSIDASTGIPIGLQISLWNRALPADAIPPEGWLELTPPDRFDWPL